METRAFRMPTRRAHSLGVVSMLMSLGASAVQAQNTPVVFNHGFFNQGSAWIPTASYLQQRLLIDYITPSTVWDRPFSEQSANYGSALNSWGQTNAVGLSHSNGGVVARNYVHTNGGSSRVNRLATIGSPHWGAPIAGAVINGRVFNYFGSGLGYLTGAVNFYANNDPAWNVHPVVDFMTQNALGWIADAMFFIAQQSAFAGLGVATGLPVTADDVPGSLFMSQFNSPTNLATESSALQARVGISTQAHPNGVIWRLLGSSPTEWRKVQTIAAAAAMSLYFHYINHTDWWLASHADYWLMTATYIALLDVAWQDFTGTLVGWNGYYALVAPGDGFIPHASSAYPNGTMQANMNLPQHDIVHVEQKDHPSTRAQFEEIFVNQFGVARVPAPPPPPPPPPPTCWYVGPWLVCEL